MSKQFFVVSAATAPRLETALEEWATDEGLDATEVEFHYAVAVAAGGANGDDLWEYSVLIVFDYVDEGATS